MKKEDINNLVCPFCGQKLKELSRGLTVKKLSKTAKLITEALKYDPQKKTSKNSR